MKPVHLRIDSSGLQCTSASCALRRKPGTTASCTSLWMSKPVTWSPARSRASGLETLPGWRHSSARSSVPSPRPRPDAAYDTGDVYKTLENHRAHRSPKVLIPPRKGAQLALDSAGTRQRNRNIRARSRVGKRKWYVASGYSRRSKVETTFHRYKAILAQRCERGTGVPESRGEVGVQDPEHHDGARDTRWRDDRMTGRRSHGRLSALNGVVHQGTIRLLDQDKPAPVFGDIVETGKSRI